MEFHQARAVIRSSSRSISTTVKNSHRCPGCGSPVSARRTFASTPNRGTRLRRQMWQWYSGPGAVFREPVKGSTNYLGAYDKLGNRQNQEQRQARKAEQEDDENENEEGGEETGAKDKAKTSKDSSRLTRRELQPFVLNGTFQSHHIMSEELKEEVFRRVVGKNQTIREVSISLGIEMERVAACARMKMIEHRWKEDGKKLSIPYAHAIEDMVPKTSLDQCKEKGHESINDLPVHPYTTAQIFHPTAESRHFTREDAAQVFSKNLLPPEKRIAHPVLVEDQKRQLEGVSEGARRDILKKTFAAEVQQQEKRRKSRNELEAQLTTLVKGRPEGALFRFKEVSAESMGRNPHSPNAVGWRYGNPHNDRKKGMVKIPTSVE